MRKEQIVDYIGQRYGVQPENPWPRYPEYTVFRHGDNQKWFALYMVVENEKLGLCGKGYTQIVNIKLDDPILCDILVQQEGYLRGYHMRGNWISIRLDGSVPSEEVCRWIDQSYLITASARKRQEARPPKEWIIPANPIYFDIEHAFDGRDEINWKQGRGIKVGDTVVMYAAAPVSAILYKCVVLETNIPFHRIKKDLTISGLMRLRLLKRYPKDLFTFARLKEEFAIFVVRGPRGIPQSLREALK